MKRKKVTKKAFNLLTGVIIGSAVGSILGLTLAPKKGKDSREYLRSKSKEILSGTKANIKTDLPLWKRVIVKWLTKK